jgi:hypothetical protein
MDKKTKVNFWLEVEEAKRLAKLCGFSNLSEYVRWAVKNAPRLMGLDAAEEKETSAQN